jgi:competence protein ComEC
MATVGAANRLVMASHHGSQSANSVEWLDALRPDWVVAQAGYRNRYRHPAAAVQQRWAAAGDEWGMQWVETAWCGAATWRSRDPKGVTCERERQPRVWQHREEVVR